MKKFIIAFDLHGTLLDDKWKISDKNLKSLNKLLSSMNEIANFYVCTGNEMQFIEKYLPYDLINIMTGFICESGCIIHTKNNKTILVNNDILYKATSLKNFLAKKSYKFIKYFAQREATISIFTIFEGGGDPPEYFYDTVQKDIIDSGYGDEFYLTWSNVALDIIPRGYNKWTAIKHISQEQKTIAFMDSYNDKEVAQFADLTYLPQNASKELISYLRSSKLFVFPLGKFHLVNSHVYISSKQFTEGTIDGLKNLHEIINK